MTPHERTPEEREAARLERLRKRAELRGEAPPPPATPGPPAAVPAEPAPVTRPPRPPREEPQAPSPDEPSGVVRSGRPAAAPAADAADLPEQAAAAGGRPTILVRGPKRRRRIRRTLLVVPAILLIALLWFVIAVFQPFHGKGDETIRVTIPKGATVSQIAELLEARGVVDSARNFRIRAFVSDHRSDLKAGSYFLRKNMSYGAAIDALTGNPLTPKVLRVVVPEGKSIREARPIVRDAGVRGPYRQAAIPKDRDPVLDRLGAPSRLRTLEGVLFPATYELPVSGTARQLVRRQIAAFDREFSPTRAQAARACPRSELTPYEVVIVASMVEREATLARERAVVASVICNRLDQGIPLGIDATIRYKVRNWDSPLKQSELEIDSRFNTRKYKGLPPTPIGSPGAAALEAALKPRRTKYLFYVVKPCANGAHAFSSSDAQFQKDVAAYNKKRDELGRDPSTC